METMKLRLAKSWVFVVPSLNSSALKVLPSKFVRVLKYLRIFVIVYYDTELVNSAI